MDQEIINLIKIQLISQEIKLKGKNMQEIEKKIDVTFKKDTPKGVIQLIQQKLEQQDAYRLKLTLNGCQVDLHQNRLQNQNKIRRKIYPFLKESKTIDLTLLSALKHNQSIIYQIAHVHFGYLKILNLQSSKITNFQALSWIDCPQLKKFTIDNNKCNLRLNCLSKCNFPQLKIFLLKIPKISLDNKFHFLQRMKVNKQIEIYSIGVQQMYQNVYVYQEFHSNGVMKSQAVFKNYSKFRNQHYQTD